jgi:hypothetical protein
MSNERMQAAFKDLQESLSLMAHIEERHPRIRSEEDQARFEANVAEITDKLNRLIKGDEKGKIES